MDQRPTGKKVVGLWRDMGRLGLYLAVLAALYTFYVIVWRPGSLLDWINTLLSTLLSVFAALAIGLLLFQHQTRETDRKKKKELTRLLRTELSEIRDVIQGSKTKVPEEALRQGAEGVGSYTLAVKRHYAHPLVVEEAIRSGLFGERQTADMFRLARNMRAHQARVSEVITTSLWNEMTLLANYGETPARVPTLMNRRYAEAGRSVQESEDRIIEGCTTLLDSLEDGVPEAD